MRFLKTIAALSAAAGMGLATIPVNAQTAPTPGTPGGIDLSVMGVQAPSLDVGTSEVKAGTLQYSNSGGTSDAFSVGTSTSVSASASASSTPDYNVTSQANFGVDTSAINQVIGTSSNTNNTNSNSAESSVDYSASQSATAAVSHNYKREHEGQGGYWRRNQQTNSWETTTDQDYTSSREAEYNVEYSRSYENIRSQMAGEGTISGAFAKTSDTTDSSNNVTVKGIGADNTITAASGSVFSAEIEKGSIAGSGANLDSTSNSNSGTGTTSTTATSSSAGTASGSAAGNVSTTASANASSTQFVSSFVQAY